MTIVTTSDDGNKAVTLRVRGGDGRMRRTKANVERSSKACDLYSQGWTFQRIADELGYSSRANAKRDVEKALREIVAAGVETLRARQSYLLDRLLGKAVEIMERSHFAHSQGRVVRACPGPNTHDGCTATSVWDSAGGWSDGGCPGIPVLDDGPKLQAITVARGLLERSAKLHGLDAPVRTAIEGDELVIRIKGVDTDSV